MDPDLVAGQACRPATGLSGPGGAASRAGPVGPAAAAGYQLGNREPQAPVGGSHARRAVPAARGRLFGELRRLRIRRHRQQAQDPAADEPGAGAAATGPGSEPTMATDTAP